MHVKTLLLTVTIFSFLAVSAQADMKQIKTYKEAFPGELPKCTCCHVEKMPKKDEGKHDLNEYGQKVKAENPAPTAETYQKVGKAPDVE